MTEPDSKFEEEIRRALYAAGDLIVPAGDGLNKIRERAARRPPVLNWLLACATYLPRRLVHGGRVAASEVAATTHGYSTLRLVRASARRWPDKARHALRTPSVWLRPVLATATALILVTGVTLSIPRLRAQVTAQLDSAFGNSSNPDQGSNSGPGGGGAQSNGASAIATSTATHTPGKPFLATMPPGTQCRGRGSQRTSGTGATRLGVALPGDIGPLPASVTCPLSTPPSYRSTAPQVTSPTTVPYTSPTTTPVVAAPSTTPVTTPPPTTTPPRTTPPTTTPPTTTPPTSPPPTTPTSPSSSTSSANSTQSTGPTGTATPGS